MKEKLITYAIGAGVILAVIVGVFIGANLWLKSHDRQLLDHQAFLNKMDKLEAENKDLQKQISEAKAAGEAEKAPIQAERKAAQSNPQQAATIIERETGAPIVLVQNPGAPPDALIVNAPVNLPKLSNALEDLRIARVDLATCTKVLGLTERVATNCDSQVKLQSTELDKAKSHWWKSPKLWGTVGLGVGAYLGSR